MRERPTTVAAIRATPESDGLRPRLPASLATEPVTRPPDRPLPEPHLGHLRRLTDDRGVWEHAEYDEPRTEHGYCTDDNARALVVACHHRGASLDATVLATVTLLSPLLSNIMLDDLDRELERRGHRFVRYADDVRVFVRSERAAHRVLDGITDVVEGRLKLKVNREKSSISTASVAGLLGFAFYFAPGGKVAVRVHPNAYKRLKMRLKQLTRRNWGVSMEHRIAKLNRFIAGLCAYFAIADGRKRFEAVDEWVRRRLRQVRWKEWKRYATKRRNLRALGMSEADARQWAASSKGSWRIAGSAVLQRALPNSYWHDELGLQSLTYHWHRRRGA